jgi:periplasmic protein TonB
MTNNEIMQANLLDIVFENRNKEYGAYALRNGYNNRLLVSLGVGMSVILGFIFISNMNKKESTPVVDDKRNVMVLKEYKLPPEKIKEPVKPKEVAKAKPKVVAPVVSKVAEVKFTTPVIKEVVKTPPPANNTLDGKTISDKNKEGEHDKGIDVLPAQPAGNGGGTGTAGTTEPKQSDFVIQEKDPEFPGGSAALQKFLSRYLTTPDELVAGEKKVVKIKFKVDKDGSVNTFEIVTSGGTEYDKEVVRVAKKMPKWLPAIQNGVNVPVSFVLPVTFIGLEE